MNTPGRNDPCPCGSGKKYKQCCLRGQGSIPILGSPSITPASPQPGRPMENTLYQLYLKEEPSFRWFADLDAESLRQLLIYTWYTMLWNPVNFDASLQKFYGHVIDGPNTVRFIQTLKRRHAYCETYAWAIPNPEAIDTLVKHSPLIEIGAGRGYWAALAAAQGADIIAFDPNPPDRDGINSWHRQPGMFFNVARADLEIVSRHPDRTLFLCWPPFNSDAALRTLRNYKGKTVIYVGDEGRDAGTPQFCAELAKYFTRVQVVEIPRWPGINDRLEVWRRLEVAYRTT
jgi:SEC-C motif